ncbi:MAG: SagB/ThcOx family dehydrogenase [Oscillatoriales cyanobacterium SM2_2_1]|nr:SagB/ThcOx family dehydrogenase [Oscillatoriales cyanobacterium SM2_2_1]
MNESIAQHYHDRTKYDPDTIAKKSKDLDWQAQPSPYKDYRVGTSYDLKSYLSPDQQPDQDGLLIHSWRRLSRFLLLSYGLTAKVSTWDGGYHYLRSSPSAGGLYPAEVYVVSGGTPILPAGLYNYQVRTHSLVHFWDSSEVWLQLQEACFSHPILHQTRLSLVVTAVFYRSAWRYEDRAYRRVLLDSGHLLGNLEVSGALVGLRPYLIGGFGDRRLNDLLFLQPKEEGALVVAPLLETQEEMPPNPTVAIASSVTHTIPHLPDGQLLGYLHQHSEIETPSPAAPAPQNQNQDKYNLPFGSRISTKTPPIFWGDDLSELESSILKRRSTRRFSAEPLDLAELKALLDFTYQPQHYAEQGFDGAPDFFDLSLIETFVAVSAVEGLEDGCYYVAPHTQELRQVRFKNFRAELHFLCLGQELGRDAGAVVFHTADLAVAIQHYGDRAYRYLHLDAGHLGQRLNLGAIALGLGASGIAGFFDQHVNEVLGIPVDEAVLYITTIGRPD